METRTLAEPKTIRYYKETGGYAGAWKVGGRWYGFECVMCFKVAMTADKCYPVNLVPIQGVTEAAARARRDAKKWAMRCGGAEVHRAFVALGRESQKK